MLGLVRGTAEQDEPLKAFTGQVRIARKLAEMTRMMMTLMTLRTMTMKMTSEHDDWVDGRVMRSPLNFGNLAQTHL